MSQPIHYEQQVRASVIIVRGQVVDGRCAATAQSTDGDVGGRINMRLSHLAWTVVICALIQACSFEPSGARKPNFRKRAPSASSGRRNASSRYRNQTSDPGETGRLFNRRRHPWPANRDLALRQGYYGPYYDDRYDYDYHDRYDSYGYNSYKTDKFLGFLFIPLGFLIGIVGVYYFFQTYGSYFNTTSTGNATYYYYPFPFFGGVGGGYYGGGGGYGGGYGGAAAVVQQQQQQQSSNNNNNNNNNDNNNNLAAVLAAFAAFNNVNFTSGRALAEPFRFWKPLLELWG